VKPDARHAGGRDRQALGAALAALPAPAAALAALVGSAPAAITPIPAGPSIPETSG
jgi:hypothetical protein